MLQIGDMVKFNDAIGVKIEGEIYKIEVYYTIKIDNGTFYCTTKKPERIYPVLFSELENPYTWADSIGAAFHTSTLIECQALLKWGIDCKVWGTVNEKGERVVEIVKVYPSREMEQEITEEIFLKLAKALDGKELIEKE